MDEVTSDGTLIEREETAAEIRALSVCENDSDYGLVMRQLCNDDYTPEGSYELRDLETMETEWEEADYEDHFDFEKK